MKVRSLLFSTLCMLAISVTFTSCSDDDDAPWNDEGTKVELPQRRIFILNEGKADNNNAGIAFYAPNRDANDSNNNFIANIYFKQNEKQLGDTGQDILEYEDNIYVIETAQRADYEEFYLQILDDMAVQRKRIQKNAADRKVYAVVCVTTLPETLKLAAEKDNAIRIFSYELNFRNVM